MTTSTCIMCGGLGVTKAHYVPKAIRRVIPAHRSSYTVTGAWSNVEHMPMLDLEERAHGRGVFDAQPRVLCGECNSAWMTPYEDVAGPLLAEMIGSSDRRAVRDDEAMAVAMWALAALMIRSTIDSAIRRLSSEKMRAFRTDGLQALDVSVGDLAIANTRAFFGADAAGSTYIADAEEPERSSLCLLFFQSIVVTVGVGKFSDLVRLATRAFASSTALVWPSNGREHQGWPTRGQVVDSDLLPVLGIEHSSRSMFVPTTPVRRSNASRRTVIRVPEPFVRNEIKTDPHLLMSIRVFEEIVERGLAERRRAHAGSPPPRRDGGE